MPAVPGLCLHAPHAVVPAMLLQRRSRSCPGAYSWGGRFHEHTRYLPTGLDHVAAIALCMPARAARCGPRDAPTASRALTFWRVFAGRSILALPPFPNKPRPRAGCARHMPARAARCGSCYASSASLAFMSRSNRGPADSTSVPLSTNKLETAWRPCQVHACTRRPLRHPRCSHRIACAHAPGV